MSAAHPHTHSPDDPARTATARRLALLLLIPTAVLAAVGMLLLWPQDPPRPDAAGGQTRALGHIIAVEQIPCPPVPEAEELADAPTECGTATVKLTDGPGAGRTVTTEIPSGSGAIDIAAGDKVTLLYLADSLSGMQYAIADHQRATELWLLGAAFVLAVLAFGRWRGLTALLGLGVTFAVLLLFIVPAILDGRSPLLVAIVGAAAIMLTVLYLTHGLALSTTIAVAGTLASLTITAVLSALATAATHLTGVADETSNYLSITQGEVNMRGLLLAGIVIGSLGVLDDVTVTQSVTVTELARANPAYRFRQLYRAATRVGRAHIASVINTIVLAYAGASLPLMLLFAAGTTDAGELITGELITQELVRAAVGTIGLITAVPITTALAALLATRHPPTRDETTPAGTPAAGNVPAATTPPATPAAENIPAATTPPATDRPPRDDPWMAFVEHDRDQPR
jgi:uncharacterized membrane protein